MTKAWWIGGTAALIGMAAAAPAIQSAIQGRSNDAPIAANQNREPPTARAPSTRKATPMVERVATLGILNKRNGLSRDLNMKPGDAIRIGDAVVRLKACDQTEPWEREQLTGGFVQLIVRGADAKWRKVFSGWLYKETPSLNVVEHPIYDVWVKACTMAHPDIGPDTVVMSGGDGEEPASTRPKARKSPSRAAPPSAESAEPSDTM
jgi:hypothetical protein